MQAEFLGELIVGFRGLFATTADDQEQRVGHNRGEQQCAVDAAEFAVPGQAEGHQAGADHDRHVEADQLARHHQRRNQRRHAEDQQHVGDVAADHVANGDIAAAIERSLHADRRFRCAGAEGDHGQADDQRRNAELRGEPGCAAYQYLRAGNEQHQAGNEIDEGHQGHDRGLH